METKEKSRDITGTAIKKTKETIYCEVKACRIHTEMHLKPQLQPYSAQKLLCSTYVI